MTGAEVANVHYNEQQLVNTEKCQVSNKFLEIFQLLSFFVCHVSLLQITAVVSLAWLDRCCYCSWTAKARKTTIENGNSY